MITCTGDEGNTVNEKSHGCVSSAMVRIGAAVRIKEARTKSVGIFRFEAWFTSYPSVRSGPSHRLLLAISLYVPVPNMIYFFS